MAKQLKLRRGTTSQHSSFTGAEGEVTVDTTKDTLVVHDGSTAGGTPLAKESDIPSGYTHPNHSGEVTSTGDGATVIADNVVDEANLKVSNSPTNGQVLTARSGNTGGMTWEATSGLSVHGSSGYIQYNDGSGGLSSENGLRYDAADNRLYAPSITGSGDGLTNVPSGVTITGTSIRSNGDYMDAGNNLGSQSGTGHSHNVLLGYEAGHDMVSGQWNTLVGSQAGKEDDNMNGCTGIGYKALQHSAGNSNVAVGYEAIMGLTNNTTGYANVAVGYMAVQTLTSGNNNVGIGQQALYDLTTGSQNTAIGLGSLANITNGEGNTAVGAWAGDKCTGHWNTFIGQSAGSEGQGSNSYYNVCLGYASGQYLGNQGYNVFIGKSVSQYSSTSRSVLNNVGIGYANLDYATSANNCVAVGHNAMEKATTASYCVAIGPKAMANATVTNDGSIGIGYQALYELTSGSGNVAIGENAGNTVSSAAHCTFVGRESGKHGGGANLNTGIGYQACRGNTSSNISGYGNAGIGSQTLMNLTSGINNYAGGLYSGYSLTTGTYNTFLGYASGYDQTTGGNNTLLGHDAGRSDSPSGQVTTGSNVICLGNNSVTDLYCNDTSISSSDKRDKTDVTNFTHGLDWVNKLNPVTYRWDKRTWYNEYNEDGTVKTAGTPDGSKKKARQHIGFLAQDVLAVEQADGFASKKDDMLVVNINEDDTAYGLKYERLVPVLVNAIKELSAKVTALEAK